MIGVFHGVGFRAEVFHSWGTFAEHQAAVDALARLARWSIERIRDTLANPRRVVVVVELQDGEAFADVAHESESDREAVARVLGAARA